MTPRGEAHVKQWQSVNKQNAGNRKHNQGLCVNCQADFATCSNDCELDGESQVGYCSYLNVKK
jgi:hypothetical protein